ncbi:hypothetical protein GJ496_002627 [Pomphorhynchus laevis]|nr:hypothetical protein GJ496_002627 [Pomphorhynchus laevis]
MIKKYNIKLNEQKSVYRQTSLNYLGYLIDSGRIQPDPQRTEPLRNFSAPENPAAMKRALGLLSYYSQWIPNYSAKIRPLLSVASFPMNYTQLKTFDELKDEICKASLTTIDEELPYCVETNASSNTVAAILSQNGRPVAFYSRSLSPSERQHSIIEREATAIVEAIRK